MTVQLILFTRYPQPGQAKTRLIPALGAQGAADLHRQLTEHCLEQLEPACGNADSMLTIFYTGGSEKQMREWIPNIPLVKQHGDTLGERMIAALACLQKTEHPVLLFGSDCPGLNMDIVQQAQEQLTRYDLVLGPTFDGGFYLLGINPSYPKKSLHTLLSDIDWGTDKVLEQTLARAKLLKNASALLPPLHDIDLPQDLEHFDHHTGS